MTAACTNATTTGVDALPGCARAELLPTMPFRRKIAHADTPRRGGGVMVPPAVVPGERVAVWF
jgi:hypothetical protein